VIWSRQIFFSLYVLATRELLAPVLGSVSTVFAGFALLVMSATGK
jgi:hypothetical protein